MSQVKDWRGTPIEVGSKVVYPGRYSSSLYLIEATVTEILPNDRSFKLRVTGSVATPEHWSASSPDKERLIERVDRVTVVQ